MLVHLRTKHMHSVADLYGADPGCSQKYPDAKQFRTKPLANFEELETLFSGVSATGTHNWSSGMEGISQMGKTTTAFSPAICCDNYVRLTEEDENIPSNPNPEHPSLNHPIQDDEQPTEKKQKKRKVDETREEICKIVSVLEKSDNNGPSMTDCFSMLKRFLNYKDPLYFIATSALCKRKEYREVCIQMDSDEERLGWIQSLQK
ncbi:hypothetical protein Ddye_013478 [Dipteronia dyeriana]|uniref:Uncharacterized protein n=1 Tax=Dipteronia dyeriana TaxID=168575 RepID=A0AAE0CJM5_9ROSI|nr:hypothetical protein Ddye_013478 [Dipteronia dyeriana]